MRSVRIRPLLAQGSFRSFPPGESAIVDAGLPQWENSYWETLLNTSSRIDLRPTKPKGQMAPLLWPYFKYSCIALDNGLLEVANAWGHRSTFSILNGDSQNIQSISVVSGVSLAYSGIQAGAVPHWSTFQRLLLLDNENKTLARLLSTPTGQMGLPGPPSDCPHRKRISFP